MSDLSANQSLERTRWAPAVRLRRFAIVARRSAPDPLGNRNNDLDFMGNGQDFSASRARPLGLNIGMALAAMNILVSSVLLAMAVLRIGHLSIQGEEVASVEFLNRVGPLLAVQILLLAPPITGLAMHRAWARPMMIFYWLGAGAWALGQTLRHDSIGCSFDVTWLVGLPIAYWYLYRKANVVAYFRSL